MSSLRGRSIWASRVHRAGAPRPGPATVVVDDDGRVAEVRPGSCPGDAVDLGEARLAPGLLDVHVNGWAGVGAPEVADEPTRLADLSRALARTGVTAYVLTEISRPAGRLAAIVRGLREALDAGHGAPPGGARCLGVHLEGPWLAPGRRGAHPAEAIRPPDLEEAERLREALGDRLRMVTLAPEREGALEVCRHLVAEGVRVLAGHTEATADELAPAIAAGLTGVTHLYNAMSGFHHRAPGVVGAALTDERLTPTLIADGVHVSDRAIDLALRARAPDPCLISDAIPPAGLPAGRHEFGGGPVRVTADRAERLDGTLAGSVAPLLAGVRRVARRTGDPAGALRLAAARPAAWLGAPGVGVIAPGRPADLLHLGPDALDLRRVWVAGEPVGV